MNKVLVYNLFEFAVKWIPAIRTEWKLTSVPIITCITAITDKKIIKVFYVSEVLCFSPQSYLQIK